MRLKRIIIVSLALLTLSGCSSGTSKNVVLSLKENEHHVYDYNSPIDIDDYVYCSHPYLLSSKVTHNGETEEFNGNIYWPSSRGTYEFTSTCEDKSVSFKVDVGSPNITISYNEVSYISLVNKFVTFEDILTNANFKCSLDDYEIKVTNIEYRVFNISLEGNLATYRKVTNEAEITAYYYKPLLVGEYKIDYEISVDDKTKSLTLSNYVLDSLHDVNPSVYQDTESHNGTNKVVYCSSDNDIFFLPKTTSYSEASYVTLKDKLTVGKTISVLFKGRSLPQIGLYVNPNFNSSNPFGLLSSKSGYLFTMETRKDMVRETDKYFLVGTNLLNNGINLKESVSGKDTFFGWDNLTNEYYYRLDVSLKEFGGALSINYTVNQISNYGTASEVSSVVASLDDSRGAGVQKRSDFDGGYVTFYSSQIEDVIFKAIYADYEKVNDSTYIKRGWTNPYNGNTILGKVTAVRNWDDSGIKNKDHLLSVTSDSSVLSLKGDYREKTTLNVEFTGKNIPNICLFADKYIDTELYGGDKGIMISAGTTDPSYCSRIIVTGPYRYDTGNPRDDRYMDKGVTKYDTVFGANDQLVQYDNCPASYNLLQDGKNYKFIVQIAKNSSNEYCIGLTLMEGTNKLWSNITTDLPYGLRIKSEVSDILGDASNIMLFGSFNAKSINFKYNIVKEQ